MFEAAEVGNRVAKEDFEREVPDLRADLVQAQFELRSAPFAVLVLIAGDDRQACEESFDLLHEWMDARFVDGHAFGPPTEEERERPRFWRYWRSLPARGEIGVHLGAWAVSTIADRLRGDIDEGGLRRRIEHVRRFERALADDGTLILKFWLHVPREELKKRRKRSKKGSRDEWLLDEDDLGIPDLDGDALPTVERFLRETSTAESAWHIVESTDSQYWSLVLGRTVRDSLRARLSSTALRSAPPPAGASVRGRSVLEGVDLSLALSKAQYRERIVKLQARMSRLTRRARREGLSSVLVFEGWDASGKGGAIRRLTAAMAARDYRVVQTAAPTDEERARHYLWRFWRQLTRPGRMLLFDRSWYGRVLVERVEGFATEAEWRRAYEEINDFEQQLVEHGLVLAKFWLHIDRDEQLRRFHDRERTPHKRHKISPEDYRNREKWDEYAAAVDEMVARTSTDLAPWRIVPGNNKRFARIQVLETMCAELGRRLDA